MGFMDWYPAHPSGLNRARDYAVRLVARGAPPWLPVGAIPLDSVLIGEGLASASAREVSPDEPWSFGLTEGERSQVRLIHGEGNRAEQAELLRATHAVPPGQVRATYVAPTSTDITPTDLDFTPEPVAPSEPNEPVVPEPEYMAGLTVKEKALVDSINTGPEGKAQYAAELKAFRKRQDEARWRDEVRQMDALGGRD